jgi:hypothetical protein
MNFVKCKKCKSKDASVFNNLAQCKNCGEQWFVYPGKIRTFIKRFTKVLLPVLLLLLTACSADLGSEKTVKTINQKEAIINYVGDIQYWHYFQDEDGNKHRIETTKKDYEALGLKGAGSPAYKGMKWLNSAEERQVEVSLPPLNDEEYVYYIDGDGVDRVFVKEKGKISEKSLNYIYNNYEKIITSDNRSIDINP